MNTRKYSRSLQEAFQDADYASPYCPGQADTSDPYFAAQYTLDKAALWAAVIAPIFVAAAIWRFS